MELEVLENDQKGALPLENCFSTDLTMFTNAGSLSEGILQSLM